MSIAMLSSSPRICQLHHQTLAQIAGCHAGRVEPLDDLESLLNVFERVFTTFRRFLPA
jgi:hypothetical protein